MVSYLLGCQSCAIQTIATRSRGYWDQNSITRTSPQDTMRLSHTPQWDAAYPTPATLAAVWTMVPADRPRCPPERPALMYRAVHDGHGHRHCLQLWRDLQPEQQMFDEWPQGEHR